MDDFEKYEQEKFNEELRENRVKEQKDNNDYDYNSDRKIEKCDCGHPLNSHGHCPICDY